MNVKITNHKKKAEISQEYIYLDILRMKNAIKKLQNYRASGPGGKPAVLIKYGTDKLFEMLREMFEKCINGGDWKIACVTPIYKKGKRNVCSNYGDISVISTFSKIRGHIIKGILEEEYCRILVGSISQWNFIALKIQYTTVDYSQQLYNTRPNSTSSLTQLPKFIRKSLVMFPFKLLCDCNKSIVMQQDCYVTMETQLVYRSCYQGNLICNIAPSLKLLVPSSPQVRCQSVHMSHYHLRSIVALGLVDHVVDPSDALVTFLFLAGRYGLTQSPSLTPIKSIRRF
jgi:hypothetical protein